MVAQTMTAQERIAAMKQRVIDKKNAEREAARREKQIENNWAQCASDLEQALASLQGIPIAFVVNGTSIQTYVSVRQVRRQTVKRNTTVMVEPANGALPELISFVNVDDDDGKPIVLHDDEKITIEISLDLATSVVEAHFDEEAVALDDEIPF